MLTFADLFTGAAALSARGRSSVGRVLGCRPATVAVAPLGDVHDREYRHRLSDALVDAVSEGGVQAALADVPLDTLVPTASFLADEEIGSHQCGVRTLNLLGRHGVTKWSALLALRGVDTRDWFDGGGAAFATLVGLAFRRGLITLAALEAQSDQPGAVLDLHVLLEYDQASAGPLSLALTRLSTEDHPEAVRQAAQRLLAVGPAVLPLAPMLSDILAAAGDDRDVALFTARTLRLAGRPSTEEAGAEFGISAERVRQIRHRGEERVRMAAGAAPEPFRALTRAVRGWLGSAVPIEVADGVARRLGVGSASTSVGGLLMWLAGPYQPVSAAPQWMALDPVRLSSLTRGWISEDGGVRTAQEVRDELAAEGVRTDHAEGWMAVCGGALVDDMVVDTGGALASVVERLLFAAGRGMSPVEMARLLGLESDEQLRKTLRRDQRFVRVVTDIYELVEWGASPATDEAEPIASSNAGYTALDGRWWWRVPVDQGLLAGAARRVPLGLLEAAALGGERRRTFASRYGPVSIVQSGVAAECGPLRHVALASGARAGDELWLGFDPIGDVAVRLVSPQDPGESPPPTCTTDGATAVLTTQGTS